MFWLVSCSFLFLFSTKFETVINPMTICPSQAGTKGSKLEKKEGSEKENRKSIPRANVRFSPKPSPWRSEPSQESKSPFTEVHKLTQIPRGKPLTQQKQKKVLKDLFFLELTCSSRNSFLVLFLRILVISLTTGSKFVTI